MSFFYRHFGIPRKIEDFIDLAHRGKVLDFYVRNDRIIIPSRYVISYGLQSGKHSLTLEKVYQKIKLGKPLKDEDQLYLAKVYHRYMQSAITTCESWNGIGLDVTVNGDSPERARQKLNLLESRVVELEKDPD